MVLATAGVEMRFVPACGCVVAGDLGSGSVFSGFDGGVATRCRGCDSYLHALHRVFPGCPLTKTKWLHLPTLWGAVLPPISHCCSSLARSRFTVCGVDMATNSAGVHCGDRAGIRPRDDGDLQSDLDDRGDRRGVLGGLGGPRRASWLAVGHRCPGHPRHLPLPLHVRPPPLAALVREIPCAPPPKLATVDVFWHSPPMGIQPPPPPPPL